MMNFNKVFITTFGENALLIRWENIIDPELLKFILQVKSKLEDRKELHVLNTYNEILLTFSFPIKNAEQKKKDIQKLIDSIEAKDEVTSTLYHIPVCYDENFGIDMELLCKKKELQKEEVVKLHTAPIYTLYFIGFLPGFLYLGGLDKQLYLDRKEQPRKSIAKGAVGIAGKQTGIYPKSSPAGWQIIGNCPLLLFDVQNNPPCLFKAGDGIKFQEISLEEHQEISKQVKKGKYQLKTSSHVY